MKNIRWSILFSIFLTSAVPAAFGGASIYEMKVDLDGDGKKERVAYDTAGVITYGSDGKMSAIVREVPNLRPVKNGNIDSGDEFNEVSWELWRWGVAEAVVITATINGGSSWTSTVWVVYQGPRSTPMIENIATGRCIVDSADVDEDGYGDLVIWENVIPSVSFWNWLKNPGQKASYTSITLDCLSESQKMSLPYIYTLDNAAGDFRCLPLSPDSARFRRARKIWEEWETNVSVLVQRMKSSLRGMQKARSTTYDEKAKCSKDIEELESLLALLYGE